MKIMPHLPKRLSPLLRHHLAAGISVLSRNGFLEKQVAHLLRGNRSVKGDRVLLRILEGILDRHIRG